MSYTDLPREHYEQGQDAEDKRREREERDPQRAAYLQKRCTCGSGLADGLCVNCWPQ